MPNPSTPVLKRGVLEEWKLYWLPLLSAGLSFLAFPRIDQGYLAWISLLPLLFFVVKSASVARAFWGGVLAGAVQFSFLLVWIPGVLIRYGNMYPLMGWLVFLLLPVLQGCFWGVACGATRLVWNQKRELACILFPCVWVTMEYFRNVLVFGGFPWLQLGYSQTSYLQVIQIADITGVYGVSFLIAWMNAAVVCVIVGPRRRFIWMFFCCGVLQVAASLIYGHHCLNRWTHQLQPSKTVAILQGNLSFDEPESVLRWKFQEGYREMAEDLPLPRPDLILLPESPSPKWFQFDEEYRSFAQKLATRATLGLIFNNIALDRGDTDRYFNSAYFLDAQGNTVGRYDKIHLVPFGEYIPWRSVFFFVDSISRDVSDFSPGKESRIFTAGDGQVSATICFEAVFPNLVSSFVRGGSHLLVNLTNDGWYGNSAAPFQHLAMARWRAVENRRFFLRAANSGISAIIEPTGRIQQRSELFRREACMGRFSFIRDLSVYSRYGDWFALLCVIITAIIVFLPLGRGLISRLGLNPGEKNARGAS